MAQFYGIDASNEISLLEYGLLVSIEKNIDETGTQFCVYKQDEDSFGTGHFSEKEINELLMGKSWADKEDLKRFYSFVDSSSKKEYIKSNTLANKLNDLIQYFGVENIMGADYGPIDEKSAVELYLN